MSYLSQRNLNARISSRQSQKVMLRPNLASKTSIWRSLTKWNLNLMMNLLRMTPHRAVAMRVMKMKRSRARTLRMLYFLQTMKTRTKMME